MKISTIVLILLAPAASAAAQNPIGYGVPLAAERFGVKLRESYEGTLGWTHSSGTSLYSATATLRGGVVHCSASARSEEGTFSTSGPGLIEIELGLDHDEDSLGVRRRGKAYIVRAACPHPRSSTPQVASWSDEYSTYKQPGGSYDATYTASGQIILRKLPEQLKGRWDATTEEDQRSMIWNLCLRGMVCPGSP